MISGQFVPGSRSFRRLEAVLEAALKIRKAFKPMTSQTTLMSHRRQRLVIKGVHSDQNAASDVAQVVLERPPRPFLVGHEIIGDHDRDRADPAQTLDNHLFQRHAAELKCPARG